MTRFSYQEGTARVRTGSVSPRSLLIATRKKGYPREYLLSRIRGRRSKLVVNWRQVLHEASPADHLASPQYQGFVRERTLDGLWRALLGEYRWVFDQMDEGLRHEMAPYLLYVELRTIMLCLRYRAGERSGPADETLGPSLLAKEMKTLLGHGDLEEMLAALGERLVKLSPRFEGLSRHAHDKRLRMMERELIARFFASMFDLELHPAVRGLFVRLVDARNILVLARSSRSGLRDPQAFLEGGSIARERFAALLERDDPFVVLPLLRLTMGVDLDEPDPARIETALYRAITKHLRKIGRDPLGTGLVLEYLWRCSMEITNLSLLFAGRRIEREELAAELVP